MTHTGKMEFRSSVGQTAGVETLSSLRTRGGIQTMNPPAAESGVQMDANTHYPRPIYSGMMFISNAKAAPVFAIDEPENFSHGFHCCLNGAAEWFQPGGRSLPSLCDRGKKACKVGHCLFSLRRLLPHRHVGPQTRCAFRIPR